MLYSFGDLSYVTIIVLIVVGDGLDERVDVTYLEDCIMLISLKVLCVEKE